MRRQRARKFPPLSPAIAPPARSARRHAWALAALWAVLLLAYANSFGAGLIYDSAALIAGDSRVHAATAQNLQLILGQHYWFRHGESELYRPLTTLSFLFNYAILGNGTEPAGYHWINLALHAINAALVYWLALLIFQEISTAWLTAAVWAVHPVLTESVTNVVGRADLLAGLAVLAGLACHVRAGKAEGWRRRFWIAGLGLAAAVGMFSKESAIVLLAAMALHDLAFGEPGAWRSRAANYGVAALPCAAFLVIRARVVARASYFFTPFTDNQLAATDFWTGRLTAVKAIGKYLALLVWPGRLSCDYSYNQIPLFDWRLGGAETWKLLAAALACGALGVAAARGYRGDRRVFFFVLLFFVTLAPTANIFLIVGTIMGERFLYLPAIAFAGCLAIAVRALCRRLPAAWPATRHAPAAILGAIALALAARTYARNFDWLSEETLMASAAQAAPDSFKPHMSLAVSLADGRRAVAEADRARGILDGLPDDRNSMRAYLNVGICYRRQGDRVAALEGAGASEARRWYSRSLTALLRGRAIEQAFDRICRAESLRHGKGAADFGWYPVYLELGRTYLRLERPREALEALRHGRLREFQPQFFEEMSAAYEALGDSRQATVVLMEGLSMDTSQTQLASRIVDIYGRTQPRSCALRDDHGTRTLDMDCPLVKEHLCAALGNVAGLYAEVGRSDESLAAARTRGGLGCPAE